MLLHKCFEVIDEGKRLRHSHVWFLTACTLCICRAGRRRCEQCRCVRTRWHCGRSDVIDQHLVRTILYGSHPYSSCFKLNCFAKFIKFVKIGTENGIFLKVCLFLNCLFRKFVQCNIFQFDEKDKFSLKTLHYLSHSFGSMVFGSKTGIIFNNHMDDFTKQGQVSWVFFQVEKSDRRREGV